MPRGGFNGLGNGRSDNCDSGPVILRPKGLEAMKSIVVFVGKTCNYKTLDAELIVFTVAVIAQMCEK